MSRYIDADALEQHKFVSWTMPEFFNEKSLEQQAYQLGWNNAIEAIMENEPTADVVEVKRGEWIYKPMKGQFCSVCDVQSVWKYNYCPNCGAHMEIGGKNEQIRTSQQMQGRICN